jgi:rhodanese-related sulfurtransferase
LDSAASLETNRSYLLVCARGARSLATAAELARRGFAGVRSLRGGANGLATQSA